MDCAKVNKPIVIFRGDDTGAFSLRTIKIVISGDLPLSNATAQFDLQDYRKLWNTEQVASGVLEMEFSDSDTKAFPLGPCFGILRLFDISTGTPRQLTVVNKIPFFVTNRVCEIDEQGYAVDVTASGNVTIHVEFNVGIGAVEHKADKVTGATAGDLAGLDANGNLTDSGCKPSDFADADNTYTKQEVNDLVASATPSDYEQVKEQVAQNAADITAIDAKIPAQASAQNQLADKDFVNSSIATNTATFRGTYNLVSALGLSVAQKDSYSTVGAALKTYLDAHSVTQENNDYCFIQIPTADATPTEIARIDRYKCVVTVSGGVGATTTSWEYEYSLNNSGFTAAQWAAINSGITSGLVEKLTDLPTAAGLALLFAGKLGNSGSQTLNGTLTVQSANIPDRDERLRAGNFGFDLGSQIHLHNGNNEYLILVRNISGTLALLADMYAAVQQIAPAWVSGTTYSATALVSYTGVVYARKTSGSITSSTNPASDTTNWEAKKVSELFLLLTGGEVNGTILSKNTNDNTIIGFNGSHIVYRVDWDGALSPTLHTMWPKWSDGSTTTLALLQNLAPNFSTSATYAVNNLCVYVSRLYRCTTAHQGAWNSSHFTEATVEDVLAAICSALNDKAPLASPAFTGTPTAQTPTSGDDSTRVATTAFVQDAVGAIKTFQHDAGGYYIEVEAS